MIMLGAAAPVFTCKGTICFSSDGAGVGKGTDLIYRQLQATINRFAGRTAQWQPLFSPITVDGFIGAGTVTALQKIVATLKLSLNWQLIAAEITPWIGTKESIAKTAAVISDRLTTVANSLQLPPATLPPISSGGGGTTQPVSTSSGGSQPAPPPGIETLFPSGGNVATSATSAVSKALPKWPFYLGGAALAVGLGFMLFNREKNTSPVAGARWRKRY
jgi:hypothetical protein